MAQYGTILSMLSFTLTSDIIARLQALDNALVTLYAETINLDELEREAIYNYARISTVGASTRIENAVLTDSEISWLDTVLSTDGKKTAFEKNKNLITNKLSKDRERSIEEVAGCRSMLLLIYEKAKEFYPLREIDIRALHEIMMRPYLKDNPVVGRYKIQPNSVVETNHASGVSRVVFKTADSGLETTIAMQELVDWYNQTMLSAVPTVAVAAELTYRFLAIHPFQDGNGRLGRGLFLLSLLHSSNQALATVARYLAIDRQIEKHKEEYYFVLDACSGGKFSQDATKYKIEYFLAFMLKMLEKSLFDTEVYRKKYASVRGLSGAALKVLQCFKNFPELRLTSQKICAETLLPRRTVNNALNKLLVFGLIQKYGQGAGVQYQITF
jgi:Fic family protein